MVYTCTEDHKTRTPQQFKTYKSNSTRSEQNSSIWSKHGCIHVRQQFNNDVYGYSGKTTQSILQTKHFTSKLKLTIFICACITSLTDTTTLNTFTMAEVNMKLKSNQ